MAGLNRDLLNMNRLLRMNRGQESAFAAESKIPSSALPQWLKAGARVCYVSKTTGSMHNVKVQKIDERSQAVTVVFEADTKNGKKVPFSECSKMGDGTLRPIWKSNQQAAGPSPAPTAPGAKAEAPARPARPVQAPKVPAKAASCDVEDIVSSGDEGKASAGAEAPPPELPPLPAVPEADKPRQLHFLPRAVALGGKKVTTTMGPAPRPDDAPPSPSSPAGAQGPAPAPGPAPGGLAEISDEEEAAGQARARSRSRRRQPAAG